MMRACVASQNAPFVTDGTTERDEGVDSAGGCRGGWFGRDTNIHCSQDAIGVRILRVQMGGMALGCESYNDCDSVEDCDSSTTTTSTTAAPPVDGRRHGFLHKVHGWFCHRNPRHRWCQAEDQAGRGGGM
jgi:hypothetical protein